MQRTAPQPKKIALYDDEANHDVRTGLLYLSFFDLIAS
jgi:hypothetical protein